MYNSRKNQDMLIHYDLWSIGTNSLIQLGFIIISVQYNVTNRTTIKTWLLACNLKFDIQFNQHWVALSL